MRNVRESAIQAMVDIYERHPATTRKALADAEAKLMAWMNMAETWRDMALNFRAQRDALLAQGQQGPQQNLGQGQGPQQNPSGLSAIFNTLNKRVVPLLIHSEILNNLVMLKKSIKSTADFDTYEQVQLLFLVTIIVLFVLFLPVAHDGFMGLHLVRVDGFQLRELRAFVL